MKKNTREMTEVELRRHAGKGKVEAMSVQRERERRAQERSQAASLTGNVRPL